ncbi:MAG TPA: PAS domain S-box protein [Anaerolineaceae bacterium]|nr:PAS domain S-box protein [Anaerolineaceae bacterium]HPN49965.1 PAS domain S-box protein [Anaerolineaceae bacterium]
MKGHPSNSALNRAMTELSLALIQPAPVETIADLILRDALKLTRSPHGFVGYIDPITGYLICPTFSGEIWEACKIENKTAQFTERRGLWGWVLNERQSLRLNTPKEDPRSSGVPRGHLNIKRFLAAPAIIGDSLMGILTLANARHHYTERDQQVCERLAAVLAITLQRKFIEAALVESEQRYRALFHHAADAIFIYDLSGQLIEVNEVACQRLDYSQEEFRQMHISHIEQAPDPSTNGDLFQVLLSEKSCFYETIHIRKDGSAIPVEINSRLVDYSGRQAVLSMARDITLRKKVEQDLRQSREQAKFVIGLINE